MDYPVNCAACCARGENCCANVGYHGTPIEKRVVETRSYNSSLYPYGIIKAIPNTNKPECAKCPYMAQNGMCTIYGVRPLECQVYPFFIDNDNNLYLSYSCSDSADLLKRLYDGDENTIVSLTAVKNNLTDLVPEDIKADYTRMLSRYRFTIKLQGI